MYTPKWTVDITPVAAPEPVDPISPSKSMKHESNAKKESPKRNHRKELDDDLSEMSDAFEQILSPIYKHATLTEEIDIEGESYLREKLRNNLRLKLQEDERIKKEEEAAKNPFNVSLSKSKKQLVRELPPINDGDRLYTTLKNRRVSGSGPVAKLSDLSVAENAFLTESKTLKNMIPKENSHLLDGVLYYRVRSQVHSAEQEELKQTEERRMETIQIKKEIRKCSTAFSRRLSAKRIGTTVREMHALRNEDPNMVTASNIQELPIPQEITLARINRALTSKLSGVANYLEQGNKGNILPPPPRYSEEDQRIAERNKRIAQDQLLLNQLDAGVLPESFIKPGSDPQSVTINLSRFGIGDNRGICLGKCLSALNRLESIGLSDNRLTANSIPIIMENLNPASVADIDLSFNELHDKGMKSIANHFRFNDNVLRYLNLANCDLKCVDIKVLCNNLKVFPNMLEELDLAGNKIAGEGAMGKCTYSKYY